MLKELYIENIAIIKKLSVFFDEKFTVFTGETGAGKSIIIDSINLIMGSRGSRNLIRSGEKSCFVSALFQNVCDEVKSKLKEFHYGFEEDEDLLISREFFEDSKNICRINGKPCTVSILREIGACLLTIHGQHDNQALFDSDTQRYLIDKYGNHDEILNLYRQEFLRYQELKKSFEDNALDETTKQRQIDILKFQIQEIEDVDLKEDEEQELIAQKKLISNHKLISDNISKSIEIIDGSSSNGDGLSVLISKLEKSLTKCEDINKIKELLSVVKDMRYSISDVCHELHALSSDVDFSDDDINQIESRLNEIYKLKRKYGNTYQEINSFYNHITAELEEILNFDSNQEKIKAKLDLQREVMKKIALEISSKRKAVAQKFVEEVKVYLKQLDLPNIDLKIDFKESEFGIFGCDRLEFLISANLGEDLKPLAKIASGGELSRIMLGIKTVLADQDFIDTVIFDEIDIGVSGNTAYNIGMLLKKLARSKQVVSITHSAQVAALADKHLLLKKTVTENKTFSNISNLDEKQRQQEIARILGGVKITENTLKSAQELLDLTK